MGIDHPCGGTIFARAVHAAPAEIRLTDYQHVVIECELALRLAKGLPHSSLPHTAQSVRSERDLRSAFGGQQMTSELEELIDMVSSGTVPPAL